MVYIYLIKAYKVPNKWLTTGVLWAKDLSTIMLNYCAMAVFLDKLKVTSNGRISLGNAAMRNLSLKEGDALELFFDEQQGCLILRHEDTERPHATKSNQNQSKKKGREHGGE